MRCRGIAINLLVAIAILVTLAQAQQEACNGHACPEPEFEFAMNIESLFACLDFIFKISSSKLIVLHACSWLAEVGLEPQRLRIALSVSIPTNPESIFTNGARGINFSFIFQFLNISMMHHT